MKRSDHDKVSLDQFLLPVAKLLGDQQLSIQSQVQHIDQSFDHGPKVPGLNNSPNPFSLPLKGS